MPAILPNPRFGYSLILSRAEVDFLTTYRLQPGAVFERHGMVLGPETSWTRTDQATIRLLKLGVTEDGSLPEEVKVLAQALLESAS